MAERLEVHVGLPGRTSALAYRASAPRLGATLVLAHGAGAGQDSRFMVRFAEGLAARGVDVLTFNFLYAERRRRLPDRAPALEACYRAAISSACAHPPFLGNALFIGGKSMGGRIASHLVASSGNQVGDGQPPTDDGRRLGNTEARGAVLLGYPLHPPGKPDRLRAAHLPAIRVPLLFVQGSRDAFGTPAELQPILDELAADITLHVVENGDHSLALPKRSVVGVEQVHEEVQDAITAWLVRHSATSRAVDVEER